VTSLVRHESVNVTLKAPWVMTFLEGFEGTEWRR
jgi:hypothetical protein